MMWAASGGVQEVDVANNLYLTLSRGQWTEPTLTTAGDRLELQVVDAGDEIDGWVPVRRGWRYDMDPAGSPATGVWVAAEALGADDPGG